MSDYWGNYQQTEDACTQYLFGKSMDIDKFYDPATVSVPNLGEYEMVVDSPSGQENERLSLTLSETDNTLIYLRISVLTHEIKELRKIIEIVTSDGPVGITQTKIYSLGSSDYELVEPIDVTLKTYKDETIALIPDLELYAEGVNEIDSVGNLKVELLDLFDDLNDMEDEELGDVSKSWKKTLNRLIKKCQ